MLTAEHSLQPGWRRGTGMVAACHAVPCCVFCARDSPPFLGQRAKDLSWQQGLFCSRDQWAHRRSLVILTVALSLVLILQMLCLTLQKSFAGKFTGESPLFTASQHQLLLAFLCGRKCHKKEGKRVCFYFYFIGN